MKVTKQNLSGWITQIKKSFYGNTSLKAHIGLYICLNFVKTYFPLKICK